MLVFCFFKQKTAYEMRISDWSSDVCSSDLVKAGQRLANWDPLTRPIVSEYAGLVRFENIEEGVTVAKQLDEVTGLSTLVVITPKTRGGKVMMRPQIKLINEAGDAVKIDGTDHSVNISFPVGDQTGRASCRERGCQ